MERISRANAPPTDAPIATAMVESLGAGTEEKEGRGQGCIGRVKTSAVPIKQSGRRESAAELACVQCEYVRACV